MVKYNRKVFEVTPMSKPRMTRRDRWANREVVMRYRAYKDIIRLQTGSWKMPQLGAIIVFHIPMPRSWSNKKKEALVKTPHAQRTRNDLDNHLKALFDALESEDGHIYHCEVLKLWTSGPGKIEIWYPLEEATLRDILRKEVYESIS